MNIPTCHKLADLTSAYASFLSYPSQDNYETLNKLLRDYQNEWSATDKITERQSTKSTKTNVSFQGSAQEYNRIEANFLAMVAQYKGKIMINDLVNNGGIGILIASFPSLSEALQFKSEFEIKHPAYKLSHE
jgi:hypothetical protein